MFSAALVAVTTVATGLLANAGDLPAWAGGPITAAVVAGLLITGQLVPGKRYQEEREERLASAEREREAYKVTTPAVLASNAALDRVLQVLPPATAAAPKGTGA